MSVLLTAAELRELTGYTRGQEQRHALDVAGIPYKTIGSRTIVLSVHVQAWVEGRPITTSVKPNLSAVQ